MAGHSKWATTKHKKAVIDARRAKAFAKYIKNIEVAARAGGPDVADLDVPLGQHALLHGRRQGRHQDIGHQAFPPVCVVGSATVRTSFAFTTSLRPSRMRC